MKLKIVLIILVSAIIVAGSPLDMSAYTPVSSTVSISTQGTIPLTPGPVLDNFNTNTSTNSWNSSTGTFASTTPVGSCVTSWNAADQSLKLTYNVTTANSYAGYFSHMGGGSLAGYTAVSFYVRGESGGEFFKVELKNTGTSKYLDAREGTNYYRNTASVYINDFLDGGVTTSWRKVTIPFKSFANLDGVSSMKELVFTFESSQSGTNGSPKQGAIYIDTIAFENISVPAVKIEAAGDKVLVDSLGGNMGVTPPERGSLSFAPLTDASHTCTNALKFNFDVSAVGSYAAAYFIFGGGYTDNTVEKPDKGGWIKVPQDFSAYNYITFWARGESDTSNPTGFKVELHDFTGIGTGEPFYVITPGASNHLTATWQKYSIPLSSFKDWDSTVLNKSVVAELTFTIEYWNTPGGKEIGAMYIDDVQFEV